MIINNITARKILASMGNYTVEASINGTFIASVPAGISAGKYEIAKVSPDEAINQVEQINQICSGKDWTQETLDREISSHNFGGNATLAVSAAFFKANGKKLETRIYPKLMLLLFEGGKHGSSNLTIQEFMIIEETIAEAKVDFRKLKNYLEANKIEILVGAEGGFSPSNFNNHKALETLKIIFPNKPIAVDVAGSFGDSEIPKNVFSVEDPFDDQSWDKFTELTEQGKFLVVGDDLTVTNAERIKKAVDLKAVNGVVIKPNQIGTISGAIEAVRVARNGGLKIIVSHRGEETNDNWIVDFALFVKADYVKFGGLDKGERVAKFNRLMELGMK